MAMLLKDIGMIPAPKIRAPEDLRRKLGSFLKKDDFVKFAMTGAAIVAVFSCIILLTWHQQNKNDWDKALFSSSSALKQEFSKLENRVKRNAATLAQYEERARSVKKRSVEEEITPNPDEHYQDITNDSPVGGSVYVRWGRRDCPEIGPSRLIYHGVTAGAYYSHTGGGSNYLCLHANVSYDSNHFVNGFNGASHIYGAEWRDTAWINQLFDLQDTMSGSMQYHSVPCALCMAERRHGKITIPGRYECPEHWIHEYDGYMMATGHSDKHSTEYICVDKRPQVIPGTQGSQNGAYLWIVETQCPSLHCEPVVSGREVRCVVCTI